LIHLNIIGNGRVQEKQSVNLMSSKSLAIVFGPNLIRKEEVESNESIVDMALRNSIIEFLIVNAHSLFADRLTVGTDNSKRHHHDVKVTQRSRTKTFFSSDCEKQLNTKPSGLPIQVNSVSEHSQDTMNVLKRSLSLGHIETTDISKDLQTKAEVSNTEKIGETSELSVSKRHSLYIST
jgi:hypothetical protein